ncbi:hypothetical protein V6N11_082294 [Hibiscus sabdariffa]|uniref:Uncharacterized protein n=1 Tax=Hibiscus sabdariffa TaxID=183260 RepID=A0ABR2AG14_9ROSI
MIREILADHFAKETLVANPVDSCEDDRQPKKARRLDDDPLDGGGSETMMIEAPMASVNNEVQDEVVAVNVEGSTQIRVSKIENLEAMGFGVRVIDPDWGKIPMSEWGQTVGHETSLVDSNKKCDDQYKGLSVNIQSLEHGWNRLKRNISDEMISRVTGTLASIGDLAHSSEWVGEHNFHKVLIPLFDPGGSDITASFHHDVINAFFSEIRRENVITTFARRHYIIGKEIENPQLDQVRKLTYSYTSGSNDYDCLHIMNGVSTTKEFKNALVVGVDVSMNGQSMLPFDPEIDKCDFTAKKFGKLKSHLQELKNEKIIELQKIHSHINRIQMLLLMETPKAWVQIYIQKMVELEKESTMLHQVLDPMLLYIDSGQHCNFQQGLTMEVMFDMCYSEASGNQLLILKVFLQQTYLNKMIKYESLPTIYFSCGMYDHVQDICPDNKPVTRDEIPAPMPVPPAPEPSDTSPFEKYNNTGTLQRVNAKSAAIPVVSANRRLQAEVAGGEDNSMQGSSHDHGAVVDGSSRRSMHESSFSVGLADVQQGSASVINDQELPLANDSVAVTPMVQDLVELPLVDNSVAVVSMVQDLVEVPIEQQDGSKSFNDQGSRVAVEALADSIRIEDVTVLQ